MSQFKIPDRSDYLPKVLATHRTGQGEPIFGVKREDGFKPNEASVDSKDTSHTLTSMAKDYEFFYTGVLGVSPKYSRDMVSEFCRRHPARTKEEAPIAIDYEYKFFTGFPTVTFDGADVDFNRRIYAIVKKRWILLRDMIASAAFLDSGTGYYARINYYSIDMVDPFALKKQRVVVNLPTVPVCIFGSSSTHSFSYLLDRPFPNLPIYRRDDPKAEIFVERDNRLKKIQTAYA